jgi:hypothetical protein
MPRKRVISPEFWTDPKVMDLSPVARLLFIGCWNFADDNGVLEASDKKIKAQVLPLDDVDVRGLLDELFGVDLLRPFTAGGAAYWHIRNFLKWQRVEKPTPSKLPPPPEIGDESEPGQVGSVRSRGGAGEESPLKLSEVKISEDKEMTMPSDEDVPASAQPELLPTVEVVDPLEMEFREFAAEASRILGCDKKATDLGLRKWIARRKKFSPADLTAALANIQNEPGQWKLHNVAHEPLSWWLKSDEYILSLQGVHLKGGVHLRVIPG